MVCSSAGAHALHTFLTNIKSIKFSAKCTIQTANFVYDLIRTQFSGQEKENYYCNLFRHWGKFGKLPSTFILYRHFFNEQHTFWVIRCSTKTKQKIVKWKLLLLYSIKEYFFLKFLANFLKRLFCRIGELIFWWNREENGWFLKVILYT